MHTKRLQVTFSDSEYREIQRAAHARNMTVAAWVREALGKVLQRERATEVERKLAVVRAAAQLNLGPAVDIGQMLAEIEGGYDPSMPKPRK
jgi:hypothetical protein